MRKKIILIIAGAVVLCLAGYGLYYFFVLRLKTGPGDFELVACAMDAKICPDGSSVGRVGPDCEFAECPEEISCRDENFECTLDIPCCVGLKEVELCFEKNRECACANCGSICLPCGNGVCDERENKCNCPEDCKVSCGSENEMCGGVAGIHCCDDLKCKLDGDYPDAGGVCVKTGMKIDKLEDACEIDSDCEYIWFTGGCHTPEYAGVVMDRCQDGIGPCPSEALPREGVTCACQSNGCVTNN